MSLDDVFLAEMRRLAAQQGNQGDILGRMFVTLLTHRTMVLQGMLMQGQPGNTATVMDGPFKGLQMRVPLNAGILTPIIMGTYESELHAYILEAVQRNYKTVVNIGCGDGYYTVGLARLMPNTRAEGYDLNPKAQEGCRSTALLNGVSDRVTIGGLFSGEDFARLPARDTLVICDIEGGEEDLLDPVKYPALRDIDIIVEMHDVFKPGLSKTLMERFAPTHDIIFVDHAPKLAKFPGNAVMSEIELLLLSYEGRGGPTPWAVMKAR